MEYNYEAIEHHIQVPMKIFTHMVEHFPYHWHEEMEILFVLRGETEIIVDKQVTLLEEGDIFVVNWNEIHQLRSRTSPQLLALQFNLDHFNQYGYDLKNVHFKIDPTDKDETKAPYVNRIRSILAMMMNVTINKEEPMALLLEKHLLDLMIILMNKFSVSEAPQTYSLKKTEERLLTILKYINTHYKDPQLTLNQISDEFYLNPQYLSRYFKSNIGVPIKRFIENMRMNKSLKALKMTDERIIDIAMANGFPDAKSYYRVFKEIMGMTPSEYREQHQIEWTDSKPRDYFSMNSKESLSKLFEYLPMYSSGSVSSTGEKKTVKVFSQAKPKPLVPTWSKLMTFGYAVHGLRQDFYEQIKCIQKDIGFEYVRFHGIFSDELLIYNEDAFGNVYYNFNHVNVLMDCLLESGLRPFLELGFMPTELASAQGTVFWWNANVTPPKDIDKWLDLVEALIRHFINRYGLDEVLQWYFEFWNEPDVEGTFWKGSRKEFFQFFEASFHRIKHIHPDLKVGGFGNMNFEFGTAWLEDFNAFALNQNIRLDFFSFHIYQLTLENPQDEKKVLEIIQAQSPELKEYPKIDHYPLVQLGDEEMLTRSIDAMIKKGEKLNLKTKSFWITEWNANTDCRDLVHDTCFMATFIVKNILANWHKLEGMGFWTATDLHEEFKREQPLFHGGFGLMTYNGLKKPAYHAYAFLKRLGTEILMQTNEMIVTRRNSDYQILLFNYCHYNELYKRLDYSQITQTSRYDVFKKSITQSLKVVLEGVTGQFCVEQFRANRIQGSSYDAWVEMGAPKTLTPDGYRHLIAKSEPAYRVWQMTSFDKIELETALEPHEIQLITLKKLY